MFKRIGLVSMVVLVAEASRSKAVSAYFDFSNELAEDKKKSIAVKTTEDEVGDDDEVEDDLNLDETVKQTINQGKSSKQVAKQDKVTP